MHYPVFEHLYTLTFALLACIILYINDNSGVAFSLLFSMYAIKTRQTNIQTNREYNLLCSKIVDSGPINSSRRKIITLNFIGNGAGTSKRVYTTSSVGEPDNNGIVLKKIELIFY